MKDYKTISFIIPTIGRKTLQKTLDSIQEWPDDEVIVVKHNPPSGNWGNAERQEGMEKATKDYLAFIDDDDVYVPGARYIMNRALKENFEDYPILFKMQYPNGRVLWERKRVKNGNVGCPMILVPNNKEMLHCWEQNVSWADYQFINRWHWHAKDIIWKEDVIALLGHNDEKFENKWTFSEWRKNIK
jgi:glycosyltransferase involved in cell wall biosynthesis